MNIFKRWFTSSKEQDIDDSQNPWAGLASYEDPETAERKLKFCGRDDDSYDLARLIMGNVFVTLYGKSGIGKTSLLNAGVFPELREEQYTPMSIRLGMRDEDNPQSYQTMIIEAIEHVVSRVETINVIDEQSNQDSVDYLWNYFARHRFYDRGDELTTPVIVFDQFEEVFRGHRDEAETLLCQLDYLNDKDHSLDSYEVDGQPYRYDQNFRFVVSIREDDLYRLEDSIDNCYLPALKRCRYRLRSLSEEGARDVILIPGEGLFNKIEKDYIANAIIGESRNDDGSISTNIISLLCSRIYIDFRRSGASYITIAHVENFIKGNPFERFYNEATRGFSNKEKSYIEEHLVDSTSRRNSIPESDFLLHVKNGAKLLEGENRILQCVSTSSDGKSNRVELIHDSFCEPLFNLKKIHEEQRINITSLTLMSMVMIFIIWFISSVFKDSGTLYNLISDNVTIDDVSTPRINSFRFTIFGVSLVNLLIIPMLIYSSVRRMIITFWLSVYSIGSNAILMYLFISGQKTEMSLRWSFATIVLLIPAIALYYSIKEHLYDLPNKKEIWAVVKSTPLKFFFLIISLYLFYLCAFNKALGLPEPFNSSWGVIVIPLLTHEIIRNAFGQRLNKIALIVFCCLLGLLTYNTSVVPFALSFFALICILGMTIGIIIWAFSGLTWGKRIMAILTDTLVLVLVVILNMGFNVSKVKYNTVSHVFNWVDVVVHNQNNKVGVVSACNGDTLLPCKFDSLDHRQHYAFLNSNKVHYTKDIMDNKGLYSYKQSIDSAQWQCLFIDEVENNISKYRYNVPGTLRNDSLQVYAAKVYHEVRNANIDYLTSGRMYSLSDVASLDTLMKLQNRDLTDILEEISNSATTTCAKPINISQVTDFNKAFARSLYLCVLKDRIIRKDSINIFSLTQEIVTLYFSNAGNFELNTNYANNFNMGGYHKIFSSSFKASELRNNMLDSWYNYIMMLLAMDMGANAEDFVNKKVRHYTDILKDVQSIHDRMNREHRSNLQRMSKILQKNDKLDLSDIQEALDIYKKQLEFTDEIKEQTNTQIDWIDMEKRQMDLDFQKFINDVFTTLSTIVSNSQNIYNSEFVDICEQLYLISVLRQYEIAPIYLQYLEQMDNSKNRIYSEFKKMQEQEDSLKQIIKSFQF